MGLSQLLCKLAPVAFRDRQVCRNYDLPHMSASEWGIWLRWS